MHMKKNTEQTVLLLYTKITVNEAKNGGLNTAI